MAGDHPRLQPTRVFLLEANPLVVSAITSLVENQDDLALERISEKGTDLIAATEDGIDIAVIAWDLADMKALEVLRRLKAKNSAVKSVVFSNNREPSALRQAVRLGARGYCYQQDDIDIFFTTLRAVAAGHICIPYFDFSGARTPRYSRPWLDESADRQSDRHVGKHREVLSQEHLRKTQCAQPVDGRGALDARDSELTDDGRRHAPAMSTGDSRQRSDRRLAMREAAPSHPASGPSTDHRHGQNRFHGGLDPGLCTLPRNGYEAAMIALKGILRR